MTHPANVKRHMPAWVDGMKRAEGGAVSDGGATLSDRKNNLWADTKRDIGAHREYDSDVDPATNKGQGPTPQNARNLAYTNRGADLRKIKDNTSGAVDDALDNFKDVP